MKRLPILLLFVPLLSFAQTYTGSTLYSFTKGTKNPKYPLSLIIDSSGNLYGTALGGPNGTVFKVTAKGVETTLWDFTSGEVEGNEGARPAPSLARDTAGDLYGGLNYATNKQDFGTVFELDDTKGNYTFSAIASGPTAGEVTYADGAVYWIGCNDPTYDGACTPATLNQTIKGQTTILWTFTDSDFPDYFPPVGGIVVNGSGDVHGTVAGDGGRTSYGYIYEWSPTAGFSVVHAFDGDDGAFPQVLRQDAAGDLYGTTDEGGASDNGTVFKITAKGTFSVLYTFSVGTDGPTGNLTLDSSGNIYGTTAGSVFKITPKGVESEIYSAEIGAGLVMDKSGNLYGTTSSGGLNSLGSVYKLTKH